MEREQEGKLFFVIVDDWWEMKAERIKKLMTIKASDQLSSKGRGNGWSQSKWRHLRKMSSLWMKPLRSKREEEKTWALVEQKKAAKKKHVNDLRETSERVTWKQIYSSDEIW